MNNHEIKDRAFLDQQLQCGEIDGAIVSGLNLQDAKFDCSVENTVFLGCTFRDDEQKLDLIRRGAHVFPAFDSLEFEPYRRTLYTTDELLDGWADGGYTATRDFRIFAWFDKARNRPMGVNAIEALSQRLHDHAIDHALQQFVAGHDPRKVVAIMGGHGTSRKDPWYRKVVHVAWRLTRDGYCIASGGGPGIMEAANLGAFLAAYPDLAAVDTAIDHLSTHPTYNGNHSEGDPAYLGAIGAYVETARDLRSRHAEILADFAPDRPTGASLAVPTWFYGHEPTNLFCDHVAKYFSNGIREDTLLAVARGGVIFAPGSAGTLQEVFMDLAQNHYATFVDRSPMCFLGRERFEDIYDLIQGFVKKRNAETIYGDLIFLADEIEEIAQFIRQNPPRPREAKTPLYELPQ